ncbi:MAG: 7-carboxy-7-deazaguanine synthase [Bacteroidota bacterium]
MPRKYYLVKEVFYTLQGEGAQAGRPAVFLRFSGCNLWSGLEEDRNDAICKFCDTDFRGSDGLNGGRYTKSELSDLVASLWPGGGQPYVVCTGGEPLLQLNEPLIDSLHKAGFEIAVETNGTIPVPAGIDWICVSPKANAPLKQTSGHELKLVYPQTESSAQPACFADMDFDNFYLQAMDGPRLAINLNLAVDYCLAHPQWKLSVQTHKVVGID